MQDDERCCGTGTRNRNANGHRIKWKGDLKCLFV